MLAFQQDSQSESEADSKAESEPDSDHDSMPVSIQVSKHDLLTAPIGRDKNSFGRRTPVHIGHPGQKSAQVYSRQCFTAVSTMVVPHVFHMRISRQPGGSRSAFCGFQPHAAACRLTHG
jgi:hypothetical protein